MAGPFRARHMAYTQHTAKAQQRATMIPIRAQMMAVPPSSAEEDDGATDVAAGPGDGVGPDEGLHADDVVGITHWQHGQPNPHAATPGAQSPTEACPTMTTHSQLPPSTRVVGGPAVVVVVLVTDDVLRSEVDVVHAGPVRPQSSLSEGRGNCAQFDSSTWGQKKGACEHVRTQRTSRLLVRGWPQAPSQSDQAFDTQRWSCTPDGAADVVVVVVALGSICRRRSCPQPVATGQRRSAAGSGAPVQAPSCPGQVTLRCWCPMVPQRPMHSPHSLVTQGQAAPWQGRDDCGSGPLQPKRCRQPTRRCWNPAPHGVEHSLQDDLHQPLQRRLPVQPLLKGSRRGLHAPGTAGAVQVAKRCCSPGSPQVAMHGDQEPRAYPQRAPRPQVRTLAGGGSWHLRAERVQMTCRLWVPWRQPSGMISAGSSRAMALQSLHAPANQPP